ncbi:MAG: signal peptidase I [Litorivicinaceae bacterium]|nr:signal peptidase I [Gammaproteobacteria bacterium]RPG22558.1 MAG: signal peptidase I [Oceanospirillales bacterium TMED33]RZO77129.1 MAG: signal peptidase I [Litorivicinaceae bacterium]CAI8393688.1 MAG: Signal peptidase I [Gammaproteobacteria bacterium]
MDFTLILVVIVLVSGLIYGLDILYFKNRRGDSEPGIIIDYSRSFFPVLFLVLLLRSFLFEPFQIPSGSMLPTLKIGDFILVNKFDYGLRLPVLGKTIYEVGQPSRGDVMVFKYPEDPNINFIKRVVGIPGDTVEYRNKVVYVNGAMQTLTSVVPDGSLVVPPLTEEASEQLGGREHRIWRRMTQGRDFPPIQIPEGQYFVMGDNRDNSNDSRVWGFVDDSLIVGRAFAVWMHWEKLLSVPSFTDVRIIR